MVKLVRKMLQFNTVARMNRAKTITKAMARATALMMQK